MCVRSEDEFHCCESRTLTAKGRWWARRKSQNADMLKDRVITDISKPLKVQLLKYRYRCVRLGAFDSCCDRNKVIAPTCAAESKSEII